MESKHGVTVHWGALLIVYLAILFATSMVVLTTGAANVYYVLLLALGVPVYVVASRSLMSEEARTEDQTAHGLEAHVDAKLLAFPDRRSATVPPHLLHRRGDTGREPHRKAS